MTRAIHDRILKDANGSISDHLRNHIHLTNCIHLKNHMHRNSPMLDDKSLMRDLLVLQRSRSLRDPSASPPSWHSPFIADMLSRQAQKGSVVRDGRRSEGRSGRRLSGSSPPIAILASSRVAPSETMGLAAHSNHSSKSGVRSGKHIGREGSDQNISRADILSASEGRRADEELNISAHDANSGNSEAKNRRSKQRTRKQRQDSQLKTLSEQLNEMSMDSDALAYSHVQIYGRHNAQERANGEQDTKLGGHRNTLNKVRKRKLHGARRARAAITSQGIPTHSEFSVASNSFPHGSEPHRYHLDEGEEQFASHQRGPKNGCGIPFNWSRIHDRGRIILDKAGRSFSCGLADSRPKKDGLVPKGRDVSDISVASDRTRSANSDAEAKPLLVEASGSQASSDHAAWVRDYSGELGIFSDHLLKHDIDSDLASEARSGEQDKSRGHRHHRHQNLTQKYMPKTFRDLVGQNLVSQALGNAVVRSKVGLLYIFYGPHGTGKSSCARIFARALNCQSLEYPKPCGICKSCSAYNRGKSRNIKEVGPISSFDFESIMILLENMIASQLPSQYRVIIFDDCDALSNECWSAISKVIDRAPRRVVFILVSSCLDVLPHIIISRCQKFFFPKLKDADIIYTLQWIAIKEDLEIDKDALKLIASRSDGSLRDAEMTLEQLSLLGQRISVPLVQELVGLVSDEKLVDLLDLALSADTVNTVKNLREIMETGVEPLALMSQLATVITDILAGSYEFTNKGLRRKFFRRPTLPKEDMEKLRQALKILSEAEKQLRMSNDKLTWLTAALLQLAPDQQYTLPTSEDNSFNHSPLALDNASGRDRVRKSKGEPSELRVNDLILSKDLKRNNLFAGTPKNIFSNGLMKDMTADGRHTAPVSQQTLGPYCDNDRVKSKQILGRTHKELEEIWLEVLQKIQSNDVKEFMYRDGKLISVSFGAAPTVLLLFDSHSKRSKVEEFQDHILHAFESILGSPVIIEVAYDVRDTLRTGSERDASGVFAARPQLMKTDAVNMRSEIVEISASPKALESDSPLDKARSDIRGLGSAWPAEDVASAHRKPTSSLSERKLGDMNQRHTLVRGKVSLAHVIQQSEGCSQRRGWSKRKAVSIAEKLEQENLRLEPRSRSLLCWEASKVTRRKLSRFRLRKRKSHSLLKLFSCGRCLSSKSKR